MGLRTLRADTMQTVVDTMALEGVKVSPKVDLFSLAPADEGVKCGPEG